MTARVDIAARRAQLEAAVRSGALRRVVSGSRAAHPLEVRIATASDAEWSDLLARAGVEIIEAGSGPAGRGPAMPGTNRAVAAAAEGVERAARSGGGRAARRPAATLTAAETVQRRVYMAACRSGDHNEEIARRVGGRMSAAAVGTMKAFVGADPDADMEGFAAALQSPAPGSPAHGRDVFLERAVAAGTITAEEVPAFRRAFLNDRPAWEAMEARHAAASQPAPVASTATVPRATVASMPSGVSVDETTGQLTWRGVPVRMTSAGAPAVATSTGWVAVSAAAGLSDEELRAPYDVAATSPNGATAQMLEQGPAA